MNRTLTAEFALFLGLFSHQHSLASFHLWDIVEIFSSADGTIQFIELSTTSSGEQGLGGQAITRSG